MSIGPGARDAPEACVLTDGRQVELRARYDGAGFSLSYGRELGPA